MPFYRRTHSYRAQMEDFWGSIDGSAAEIRRALPEPRTQPNDQQRGRDGPRPTVQPARPTLDMTTLTMRAVPGDFIVTGPAHAFQASQLF